MPVPISTTARASSTEARNCSAAPPPLPIGGDADLGGALARGGQDVVLGDVGLGEGPARRGDRAGSACSAWVARYRPDGAATREHGPGVARWS